MRLKIMLLMVASCGAPGRALAADSALREPTAIVASHRLPVPRDMHSLYQGKIETGESYTIKMDTYRRPNRLVVSASVSGRRLGEANINLGNYLDIDLTPDLGVGPESIELIFRFGGYRTQCYLNDDGRDRLTVRFSTSRNPSTHVTSFANCLNE
jgi:hypothetical protein